ncbi:ABC transporter permease [Lichenifustis flavocetrariae]|uniref:ABC transporter permease n=1 Tax=Lichenifustis flavocetrariae TaxID=2949735 RepID=A0AA41YUY0_9HYPH|nr:ABC transporter permease [Lichenifustis flavocetrariae]MCW6509029.1 ABC transporter permease [Lichenifustis flavocetrariae]
MRLKVEPRRQVSKPLQYATPPLSVLGTVVAAFVLFAIMGYDPLRALYDLFVAPLGNVQGLSELALKASPLVMIGVGLAAGFRANVWNIGAEGQLMMGAIAGGGVALAFYGREGWWILPLMSLAAVAGGMAWAAVPAFLKTRFGVSEILVSLMLTYVAEQFLSYLVLGPWKDPEGMNFPQSRMFSDSALLPVLFDGTRVHAGVLVSLLVVVVAWVVMSRSILGFEIRTVGLAPAAARYAGFSQTRVVWLTLLATGGLAGLAGLFEVAGPIGQLIPKITPGYGFTAIIVAFLGRLHPLGILLAGLVMALSYIGADQAQVDMGLPNAATGLVQAMLLFFLLASDFLVRYRVRLVRPAATSEPAPAQKATA